MSTNPIVLENEKPGTPSSVWMLQPGQASSSIEGFATSMSTNIGNTVDFKINTDSTNYRVDIYRLGYYGGDGATLVTSIQHQDNAAIVQPAPLTDASTGLVDAGNWSITDSWNIPSTATSGVYIAELVRQDGTPGENLIPFVVTNNASHSDIAFQTSDQTWEAYNAWGGSSLYTYTGSTGLPQAVSYNRPIDTPAQPNNNTAAGPWDYIFGEELPAIYWLEENGYDVTYQSSIDTSTNGSLLLNHKAFLSVGHDEYWNGPQRANVTAARDAGVNLDFWSGNESYWKTELLPSIDASADPNRTLVSYKTTFTGLANPDGTWTGEWRDPAGGSLAENSLTGQLYSVDWDHTTPLNPITVPYGDSQLQIWKNTSVAGLAPGQSYTTAGAYLGYEWDVNATSNALANNGVSPPGLVPLSSTTVATNALVDYLASTLGPGTVTHNLTMYRAPSGALVFDAGTVMWSWALSSLHTPGPTNSPANDPTDPAIQQAMVNLLADEGVQPQTLQQSLKLASQSTDHVPPSTNITTDVISPFTAGQAITISGTSTDAGGGIVAGVEVSIDGGNTWNEATFNDAASASWSYIWTPSVSGSATVLARAVDDSANLEHPKLDANFAITDFESDFAVAQGWNSPDTLRVLADINGDGKSDLIGFGDGAVYGALGQGADAQYNGGASLSSPVSQLVDDFGIAQGFGQATERGVDYVGNFTSSPSDRFGTIWGVGANGLDYSVATSSTSTTDTGGVTYQTPNFGPSQLYGNFGLAQGWTTNYTIDIAFLSKLDPYASAIGFGEDGVWVGPQAFNPAADASQDYMAAGSSSLGNSSGWDSTLDLRTIVDAKGNPIDLNGDGVPDFVGMGPNGLEYAMGQYTNGQYSLGSVQQAQTGVDFGDDQGWNNATTDRFIADIMGDGHEDIIGFGAAGVSVSMGQTPNADGSGAFGQAYLAMTPGGVDFGSDQGWNLAQDTFALGDVYGNGKLDIIGFGADNTFIASPTTNPTTGQITFTVTDTLHAFGSNEGFSPSQNFRGVADVQGNGIASIIASGATNTQVVTHV